MTAEEHEVQVSDNRRMPAVITAERDDYNRRRSLRERPTSEANPMSTDISRRALLACAAGGLAMTATESCAEPATPGKFGYCLNTSTVRDKDGKSRAITEL